MRLQSGWVRGSCLLGEVLREGEKLVDIVCGCGPRADEADHEVAVGQLREGLGADGLLELFGGRRIDDEELLVAVGRQVGLEAELDHAVAQAACARVGVAGQAPVQRLGGGCGLAVLLGSEGVAGVGLEGSLELDTEQAALCHEAAALLYQVGEGVLELGVVDDHGLAEEHAVLGAAQVEGVGLGGEVAQGEVAALGGQGDCHACAIDEDLEVVAMGPVADRVEALAVPHAAELGGVGDVDHLGAGHVAARQCLVDVDALGGLGGEEAVLVLRGQDGAAARGDRAGLVRVDVGVLGADDALPVAQHASDAHDVCRGAADAELDGGVRLSACLADQLACALAVGVALGVADTLLGVGLDERLQNLGCRALGVVVPELMHLVSSRVRVHLLGARWACVRLGLYVDGRKASHIERWSGVGPTRPVSQHETKECDNASATSDYWAPAQHFSVVFDSYLTGVLTLENGTLGDCFSVDAFLRAHPDAAPSVAVPQMLGILDENTRLPKTEAQARTQLQSTVPHISLPLKPHVAAPAKPILELKNAAFRYTRDGKDVLSDLSFSLSRGEIFAVIGANGAGKTTLLRVLTGEYKPYSGKRKASAELKIAAVPQNPQACFAFETVSEVLNAAYAPPTPKALFHLLNDAPSAAPAPLSAVADICETLGIAGTLPKNPFDLSAGQQQRVAFAAALLKNPDVLLLDEPTKGLDKQSKEALLPLLADWKKAGKAVLLVTHDLDFAAACADRCALLFDGHFVFSGESRAFFTHGDLYTSAVARMFSYLPEKARPISLSEVQHANAK